MLWVTNITVLRLACQMRSSSTPISSRVMASSALNGSSISSMPGSWTSARQMAARWRMPPESWRGSRRGEFVDLGHAQSSSARRCILRPAASAARPETARCRAPCARAVAPASGRRRRSPAAAPSPRAVDLDLALGGADQPAIIISNVLLPQPLGPSRLTNSPSATSKEILRMASSRVEDFLRTDLTPRAPSSHGLAPLAATPSRPAQLSVAVLSSATSCDPCRRPWRERPQAGSANGLPIKRSKHAMDRNGRSGKPMFWADLRSRADPARTNSTHVGHGSRRVGCAQGGRPLPARAWPVRRRLPHSGLARRRVRAQPGGACAPPRHQRSAGPQGAVFTAGSCRRQADPRGDGVARLQAFARADPGDGQGALRRRDHRHVRRRLARRSRGHRRRW